MPQHSDRQPPTNQNEAIALRIQHYNCAPTHIGVPYIHQSAVLMSGDTAVLQSGGQLRLAVVLCFIGADKSIHIFIKSFETLPIAACRRQCSYSMYDDKLK